MVRRLVSLVLLVIALVVFSQSSVIGQNKDKNTHLGTLVSVKGTDFVMETNGKQHSHTLAANAKVMGTDGKECKLDDLKRGQLIRVTTKDGDIKVATKVEAMKKPPSN
jgi:hypothetical protein